MAAETFSHQMHIPARYGMAKHIQTQLFKLKYSRTKVGKFRLGHKQNLPLFPTGSQEKIGQNKRHNNIMAAATFSYQMDIPGRVSRHKIPVHGRAH